MKLRNKLFTTIGTLGAVVAPVASVVACGDSKDEGYKATGAFDLNDNTYDVVMEPSFEPVFFHINQQQYDKVVKGHAELESYTAPVATGGYNIGADVYLANKISEKLSRIEGRKITTLIHSSDWNNIIPALINNHYDSIIDTMSITPERKKQVSFSRPYFHSRNQFLFGQASSTLATQKFASVNDILSSATPVRIGVVSGVVQEDIAKAFAASHQNIKLVFKPSYTELLEDIKLNNVDVIFGDALSVKPFLNTLNRQTPSYAVGGETITDIQSNPVDEIAIAMNSAVPKKYLDAINDVIVSNDFKDESIISRIGDKISTAIVSSQQPIVPANPANPII